MLILIQNSALKEKILKQTKNRQSPPIPPPFYFLFCLLLIHLLCFQKKLRLGFHQPRLHFFSLRNWKEPSKTLWKNALIDPGRFFWCVGGHRTAAGDYPRGRLVPSRYLCVLRVRKDSWLGWGVRGVSWESAKETPALTPSRAST